MARERIAALCRLDSDAGHLGLTTAQSFVSSLTENQKASLAALLSFPGTANTLRRTLGLPPQILHERYVARLREFLLARGWSVKEVAEALAIENHGGAA